MLCLTSNNVVDWYIMAQHAGGIGDSKPSPAESRKYKKRKANAMEKGDRGGEYFSIGSFFSVISPRFVTHNTYRLTVSL